MGMVAVREEGFWVTVCGVVLGDGTRGSGVLGGGPWGVVDSWVEIHEGVMDGPWGRGIWVTVQGGGPGF